MNLEGLEMIAVLVVLVLFVKVLEQFGLFEPVSLEGNGCGRCWFLWGCGGPVVGVWSCPQGCVCSHGRVPGTALRMGRGFAVQEWSVLSALCKLPGSGGVEG